MEFVTLHVGALPLLRIVSGGELPTTERSPVVVAVVTRAAPLGNRMVTPCPGCAELLPVVGGLAGITINEPSAAVTVAPFVPKYGSLAVTEVIVRELPPAAVARHETSKLTVKLPCPCGGGFFVVSIQEYENTPVYWKPELEAAS